VEKFVNFVHEENGQVRVVRNVPAFVCEACGEVEYTQTVTRRILEILRHPPEPDELLTVPAYDLASSDPG
jgi:YgiT-type zinc finger domain-containing protein